MRNLGLILFLGLLCWGVPLFAKPWEIAVVFLNADDDEEYQGDIDRNMMELARLSPDETLRLSLLRELPDRTVTFFPDPESEALHPLQNVLFGKVQKVEVSGPMTVVPRQTGDPSLISRGPELARFLETAFRLPDANRLFVIYGHGLGYEGLRTVSLKELRTRLEEALPRRAGKPLDLLWLDSCFMASVEVAVELKGLTRQLIASEEAEFSAGAPFDVLRDILAPRPDEIEGVSAAFAERFLESYSFTKNGSQTGAVFKSSATISVIDPERVAELAEALSAVSAGLKQLTTDWKGRIAGRLKEIRMDKADLVDLGSLALTLKESRILPAGEGTALDTVLDTLEVSGQGKLKTNPRLLVESPAPGSLFVFGYEGWKRGYEGDDVLEKLPPNLQPKGFLSGPGRKNWPHREVKRFLYLTPFTVGLNRFDFYFADAKTGKPRTAAVEFDRLADYVTFLPKSAKNPLRFTGYTQGIGKTAERYSGLNILQPTEGTPSVDYLDLDFYRATKWSNF